MIPFPDSSGHSSACDWQWGQKGVGGILKRPQLPQRDATSLRLGAAFQNGSVHWLFPSLNSCNGGGFAMSDISQFLTINPETGTEAGPPVTRATFASRTWLTAVPRNCSTASRRW